jgi:hypothetical protein
MLNRNGMSFQYKLGIAGKRRFFVPNSRGASSRID